MKESSVTKAGIIFLIILAVFLIYFNNKGQDIKEIHLDAKWFEFNPNTIKLKEGEKVRIVINNLDVTHGIIIPDLGVSGNNVVEFTANKNGEFDFYCNNFCGVDHDDMVGKIIVD